MIKFVPNSLIDVLEQYALYKFLHRIYELRKYPSYYYFLFFRKNNVFLFNGEKYTYFYNPYNFTQTNERIIEVPIARKIIKKFNKKKILEVGNVLSHYYPVNYTILDKYEKSENLINEDVTTYLPKEKYDLIISISTLEHVGWNEKKKDSKKIPVAIKHLYSLLKKKGMLFFTMPLGYNPYLDNIFRKKRIPLAKLYFLKRVSNLNEWKQVSFEDVKNARYNYPFYKANALIVGIIQKE